MPGCFGIEVVSRWCGLKYFSIVHPNNLGNYLILDLTRVHLFQMGGS